MFGTPFIIEKKGKTSNLDLRRRRGVGGFSRDVIPSFPTNSYYWDDDTKSGQRTLVVKGKGKGMSPSH